jgi:hypothetical protein
MKKALLALVALVVIVVGAVAAILFTVDPVAIIDGQKTKITAVVRESLGRDVTFGAVKGSVLPTLAASIDTIAMTGATTEDKAQLEVGNIEVRISLWRAIVSLGKDLHVDAIVIRGLTVRAKRDAEGRWDFDDIMAKTSGETPPEEEKPAEAEVPKDLSFLEGARLSRVAIEDARFEIDDAALGRPLVISDFDVEIRDVALGQPIAVTLHALFEDGPSKTPIDIAVTLSELRKDLSFDPMPDVKSSVKVADLELGPWAQLLPKDIMAPSAGKLGLDVRASLTDGLHVIDAQLDVRMQDVVLREKGTLGAPLTLTLATALDVDTNKQRYKVSNLRITGTGIDASGGALIEGTGPAALQNADLKLAVADLARLVAVVPSTSPLLPRELTLAGPIRTHVNGNVADIDISVNLDDAHVAWAKDFDKKAGRPLHLSLNGKKSAEVLDIPTFELVVDTARLAGKMALPLAPNRPLTADIKTGPITVASLKDLLPAVASALSGGKRVDGTFALEIVASAQGEKADARVLVDLSALDVNLEGLTVKGSGKVDARAVPTGSTTRLVVATDLAGLSLSSVDAAGAKVLDKPVGMPLTIDLAVVHTGPRADIERANILLGKTTIAAKGGASGLDQGNAVLDLDFGTVDVAFDDVRRTVPGAAALPAGGRLRAAVKVGGDPNAMQGMTVDVGGLDLAFGRSHVKGDVKLKNLDAPVVDASLQSILLQFDDLRALEPSLQESLPAGGRFDGGIVAKVDSAKLSTLDTAVTIKELVYGKTQAKGTLALKDLDRPVFAFDISSPYLNIDELVGKDDGKKDDAKGKPVEKGPDENPHGLPKAVREQLKKVSGQGTLKVGKAIFDGLELANFVGTLRMKDGVVTFDALDFGIYGGTVSAAGTELDLGATYTGYKLKMKTKSIDLGRALTAHTSIGHTFDGRVSKDLDLSGRGLTADDLAASLTGALRFTSDHLTVKTLDVLGPIGAPLKAALESTGFGGFKGLSGGSGGASTASASSASASSAKGAKAAKAKQALTEGTTLQAVNAFLQFASGKFVLKNPLETKTPFGAMKVEGGGALDKTLDFKTIALIDPSVVNNSLGTQAVNERVAVPFQLGGTWDKPMIKGMDTSALVKSVMSGAALGKLGPLGAGATDAIKAAANAEATARAAAEDAQKKAAAAAAQAQQQAQAQADAAKAQAQAQADAAKKKAEEQADAAKKKAEAQADKAKKEAEKKAEKAKKEAEKKAKAETKKAQDKLKGMLK